MATEPFDNRKFDTKVQYIKYMVLREVARRKWAGTLEAEWPDIPRLIIPGNKPTMRCCVYKERAILFERVKIAMEESRAVKESEPENPHVIEVIDIACEECPFGGYEVVASSCRGCLAHRCADVCPRDAIIFNERYEAHIDKEKCIECGACAKVCPFSAIANRKRPCVIACKVDAITTKEGEVAAIDYDKCISCGACVTQCPFGAITDVSYITDVIDIIRGSENNGKYKVYALVAPSITSQFTYAKLGQVISGIKKLGFNSVAEVALGADMVSYNESLELVEKGVLTSSCCPAFVDYVKKNFPNLEKYVSHNLSPMGTIARHIKKLDPGCKTVFIGPCTAKKAEAQLPKVDEYVDAVITFEELQALFDSKDLDITTLEEEVLDNASYFGRIFARSGGLADAVQEGLREHGVTEDKFVFKPIVCDGIEACRMALLKLSRSPEVLGGNFIEGMACAGGCIGGAGCLTQGRKSRSGVDKYGMEASEKTIKGAISAPEE